MKTDFLAGDGFEPSTVGLWAHYAATAPPRVVFYNESIFIMYYILCFQDFTLRKDFEKFSKKLFKK